MIKTIGKCTFKHWECDVVLMNYRGNNRKALQLVDSIDDEVVAMATVNLPNEPINDDNEIFIKDYSENTGMYQTLYDAGFISKPIGYANSGFVKIPKVKLLKQ